MADGIASVQAARTAVPFNPVRTNQFGGEVQVLISTYTVPASVGPAIGESITWGTLPQGARLLPNTALFWSAGAASSTLNLGDRAAPARYLAATAVTTAGTAAAAAAYAAGALPEVTVLTPGVATDQSELRSVVAGANLQAGQVITLVAFYVAGN
ncbi:hypothetical protein [Methylibium sp.]|uniref:hypothetical protein n=1 Tax=Methylibium sp. TaxID=2067992 RepID=UPI00333FEA9C